MHNHNLSEIAVLTVSQRITSEAGAEAILDASYKLSTPLGVPTLVIDPAEYNPQKSLWHALMGEPIEKRLMDDMENFLHAHYGRDNRKVKLFLRDPVLFRGKLVKAVEQALHNHGVTAQSLSQTCFFNLVICPRTQDTSSLLLRHGLKMRDNDIRELPGYDAHWNFIKLWHEYAHGYVGESEALADEVSAMTYMNTFTDIKPLTALSDFRAVQAILLHQKEKAITVHGWRLVDSLDRALLPNKPRRWENMESWKAPTFKEDPHIADVQFVGGSLMNVSKIAFAEPDLLMLGMMSDHMAYKGNVENENQLRIARRFAIAAQRLSIGKNAYAVTQPKPSL